jgi:hypothetical protein
MARVHTTAFNETDCIGDCYEPINNSLDNLDTAVQSVSSSLGGFKNKLINAQGLINQRGYVSGIATTTANQYTVDRWRVVTSGQNLTFTRDQNVTTFTAPANGIEQVVEGLNIESGTYVLNWNGNATATVGGTPVSNGGTIPLTGGSNVTVRFIGDSFSLPQLERGLVATPFEYRPFGTELALCQRYYEKSYSLDIVPGTPASPAETWNYPPWIGAFLKVKGYTQITADGLYQGLLGMAEFKVTKRSIPTATVFSPYSGATSKTAILTGGANTYLEDLDAATAASETNILFWPTAPIGSSVARASHTHWVVNAEL